MSTFNIRKSEPADLNRNFEIWLKGQATSTGMAAENEEELKNHFTAMMQNSQSIVSVAVTEQDKIIGWQGLFPMQNNPLLSKYTAQICSYLDEDLQVPDLGRKLTEHSISLAKQRGIEHIYAWVKPDNKAANLLTLHFTQHKVVIPKSSKGTIPELYIYVLDINAMSF